MRTPTRLGKALALWVGVGALLSLGPVMAGTIVPFTLIFEREGLDLDSGTIVPIESGPRGPAPEGRLPDFFLGYHSERTAHAVVAHNRMSGVEIAFLDGVAFNLVKPADLAELRFTRARIDAPFEIGDSIVLRTDTGAHYLLGNPIEGSTSVTFDTQLLETTKVGLLRPAGERGGSPAASPGSSGSLAAVLAEGLSIVQENEKLTAGGDGSSGDFFGASVALSGDTALVGADGDEHAGSFTGAAYVFVRSGGAWSKQARLVASDAASLDTFGSSVALSGDTAVVGARGDDDAGEGSGSVYVFVRNGSSWSEQAKLTASDGEANVNLGVSVALSGDTVVAGASGDADAGEGSGAAYVFVRNGSNWSEQDKLVASDGAAFDRFGVSVALSGDSVVVGAYLDDHASGADAGSAYVFVRAGNNWTEQAKLTASDAALDDEFALSVALSGDTAVVGAHAADHSGNVDAGSAYVFVRNGSSWTEQVKLVAIGGAAFDKFGFSVAFSNETAAIGAYFDDDGGEKAGSAHVFLRIGSDWAERAKLVASDAAGFDRFGTSVAVSDGTAVVGASRDNNSRGSAYVFDGFCEDVDTTAPQISFVMAPSPLWPPNHHLVDVEATVDASDSCGGLVTVALESLTSNELDNAPGTGDGETTGDIQLGFDDFHFKLRAERSDSGSGRIYTAAYTATDASGNVASVNGFVVVPHDVSGVIDPVSIALEQNISGTVVSWEAVSGAVSYDVIRGALNNITVVGEVIELGAVECIEEDSIDENTLGWEDLALPLLGQSFFYLVEYHEVISSSYGTASAAYPRVAGTGDCFRTVSTP